MTPSRPTGADYMEWAKQVRPRARYSLALSGVPCVTRVELGLRLEDLELCGPNEYGNLPLREALGARYGVDAAHVLLAEGTSMANALLAGALLQPGERVLVESPGYEPLPRIAELFGAETVPLPRRFEDAFQVDEEVLARELRGGAKLVWLTNLHNPSGALIPRAVLERIHRQVEAAGAWLGVDEVYLPFVEGEPSAASLGPRAIVTTSFTKALGLSDIRMGWAVGDPAVLDRARRLHGIFAAQTSYPSVCIARVAVPQMDRLAERGRRIAAEGRAVLDPWLAEHPEIREVRPAGGLVSFPRLPEGTDDARLVERLMKQFDTVAVPGHYFQAPGHLRLGVGAPPEELREALRRLGQALEQ
ncbi:MAG: pyridoxal phosphate-dependent aminotransferase [Candidatus Eisenbacteria bacterium]|nr:pyridoxal phosphate-dependent aminotransferase [Candidatus Eisenbacteria bacterium]